MTTTHAQAVAALLNGRNQLDSRHSAASILQRAKEFLLELDGDEVVGCVATRKTQWYQAELLHLSVQTDRERHGLGRRLIERAEAHAKEKGARIVQCTIRQGNKPAEHLFGWAGYRRSCQFKNDRTGNVVGVWQKAL